MTTLTDPCDGLTEAAMNLDLSMAEGVSELAPEEWDRLVGEGSPFLEHAFLASLEASGCVEPSAGWLPRTLVARRDGELIGAVPLYIKGHSMGEFFYDWSWADLAQRLRVPYYPKMIAAVPFSPVTGQRVLLAPDLPDADDVFEVLVQGAVSVAEQLGMNALGFLFVTPEEAERMREMGLMVRLAHQYHWKNHGYSSFADYLAPMRSKKRRTIRWERRKVAERGYRVEARRGDEMSVGRHGCGVSLLQVDVRQVRLGSASTSTASSSDGGT